jgi:hypothetical protein
MFVIFTINKLHCNIFGILEGTQFQLIVWKKGRYCKLPDNLRRIYVLLFEKKKKKKRDLNQQYLVFKNNCFFILVQWLMAHSMFLSNPLYIAGDSYSGITVPIIVQEVLNGTLFWFLFASYFCFFNSYCFSKDINTISWNLALTEIPKGKTIKYS